MSAVKDFYQGEVFLCSKCNEEHDAETQEVGSYMCKYDSAFKNLDEYLKEISIMYGVKYE